MFTLEQLPYAITDLEPYITSKTIEYHYGKHHSGYCNKLNELTKGTDLEHVTLEDVIYKTFQDQTKQVIYNNAAQVWNHTFYWKSLKKGTSCSGISPELKKSIESKYGSLENFLAELKKSAISQFGSGWAWVVWNAGRNNGEIDIVNTSNAQNPMNLGLTPLLVLDVWEHAYYLDYQNNRVMHVDSVINNILNWDFLNDNFLKVVKSK